MKIPVTVYSEITPNPSTMKFVANKYILPSGETANFTSKKETIGYSPLAEELFQLPFVDGVFIASNFVTVTKTDNVSWDFITMQLREFIRDWIAEAKEILLKSQENVEPSIPKVDMSNLNFEVSEFDQKIVSVVNVSVDDREDFFIPVKKREDYDYLVQNFQVSSQNYRIIRKLNK